MGFETLIKKESQMNSTNKVEELLNDVKAGRCSVEAALSILGELKARDNREIWLDHHRRERTGIPEVVYGEDKSAGQLCSIFREMLDKSGPVMATRVDRAKASEVLRFLPETDYYDQAGMLVARACNDGEETVGGEIVVVTAGTSDIPVAEEARVTVQSLGHPVRSLYDIGVAGIHRLYASRDVLDGASVIIAAAGMEGALPGVISGMIDKPVIGVPTSIGYGSGFGGITPLLSMLNSCSPGLAVVNINNGFGAACVAVTMNKR